MLSKKSEALECGRTRSSCTMMLFMIRIFDTFALQRLDFQEITPENECDASFEKSLEVRPVCHYHRPGVDQRPARMRRR